jgi:hypothetical protein
MFLDLAGGTSVDDSRRVTHGRPLLILVAIFLSS